MPPRVPINAASWIAGKLGVEAKALKGAMPKTIEEARHALTDAGRLNKRDRGVVDGYLNTHYSSTHQNPFLNTGKQTAPQKGMSPDALNPLTPNTPSIPMRTILESQGMGLSKESIQERQSRAALDYAKSSQNRNISKNMNRQSGFGAWSATQKGVNRERGFSMGTSSPLQGPTVQKTASGTFVNGLDGSSTLLRPNQTGKELAIVPKVEKSKGVNPGVKVATTPNEESVTGFKGYAQDAGSSIHKFANDKGTRSLNALGWNMAIGGALGAMGSAFGTAAGALAPNNVSPNGGMIKNAFKGAMVGALATAGQVGLGGLSRSAMSKSKGLEMLGNFDNMTIGWKRTGVMAAVAATTASSAFSTNMTNPINSIRK